MSLLPRTMSGEHVELVIPAEVRYLSAARVVAASLAADAGFDLDDLDRVRVGTNELLTILIETLDAEHRVCVTFASDHNDAGAARLRISGDVLAADDATPLTVELDELAYRILTAVTDDYGVTASGFQLTVSAS